MTTNSASFTQAATVRAYLPRLHWLLTVQTIVVILLSFNRLSGLTTGYVAANEFLRWVDFHNLLTLPLISLAASYWLKHQLEYASPARNGLWHNLVSFFFVIGVYLFGAGYGAHEITNYLHVRFCLEDANSPLCRIIIFTDDDFSHWVWFAGFVLINAMLLLIQLLFPAPENPKPRDSALFILNGLFIALGIFANLAFETIGLDLYIVAILALLALALLWQKGRQPLFLYYSTAYGIGLVATAVYKLL